MTDLRPPVWSDFISGQTSHSRLLLGWKEKRMITLSICHSLAALTSPCTVSHSSSSHSSLRPKLSALSLHAIADAPGEGPSCRSLLLLAEDNVRVRRLRHLPRRANAEACTLPTCTNQWRPLGCAPRRSCDRARAARCSASVASGRHDVV